MHARKLVPYLGDPAVVSVDVPVEDGARSPDFVCDDDEGGAKRAKAAPKRKRGRPRKQPQ